GEGPGPREPVDRCAKQAMESAMTDRPELETGDAAEAPFALVAPEAAGRFVFASPHSGDRYPSDMAAGPDLPAASLRSAEDAFVDRLIAPGTARGASLLLGRLGRAYVDLNRDPGDLDP